MTQLQSAYSLESFSDPNAEINRLKQQANMLLHADRKIWQQMGFDFSKPNLKVMDLACGLGITTCELAKKINTGKVIGVDNNKTLLEYAKQYQQMEQIDHIEFLQADVYDLAFPEATFDLVFCQLLLLFLSDVNKAVSQVYRILKPGGTFCVVDVDKQLAFSYPESEELNLIHERIRSDLTARGFDLSIGPKLGSYLHHAGFTQVKLSAEFVTSDDIGLKEFMDVRLKGALALQFENSNVMPEQVDKLYDYYINLPYAWFSRGVFFAVGCKP